MRTLLLTVTTCLLVLPVQAKYSGGSGTAQDPYQIATAADLIALGETPADYSKHFILTADIDLDPKLPGRKVFDKAVIAPSAAKEFFQGTFFAGVFDGKGHTISHLTIRGEDCLGLFGPLGFGAELKNLGVVDVNITGSGSSVGGLVDYNGGTVTHCYSTGAVNGKGEVGGLVGENWGTVTQCYSTGAVRGAEEVGGLVGGNAIDAIVTHCYATGAVDGKDWVGGLAGGNGGTVAHCYSTGAVSGSKNIGALVGGNAGLVTSCFWDIQTSGQASSDGGTGKTTVEMQTASTFASWGGCGPLWTIDEGREYPRLAWENMPGRVIAAPTFGGGAGTAEDPYLIYTAQQLNSIGLALCHWDKHFKLMADIDLSGFDGKDGRPDFNIIAPGFTAESIDFVGTPFTGAFDGNGHTISRWTIKGEECLGVFGSLASGAEVKDLGVVDVNMASSRGHVGGLVGHNNGRVTRCYSTGGVTGTSQYAHVVGGLVGYNEGTVTDCYSGATVRGSSMVGGLVGYNNHYGGVACCYSTGGVSGTSAVGGLVGSADGAAIACFWDTQTSGQAKSAGGTGKTTAQMQTAKTFLDAGWDFVGETKNGMEDIWWILEGKDYPRLWWEAAKK